MPIRRWASADGLIIFGPTGGLTTFGATGPLALLDPADRLVVLGPTDLTGPFGPAIGAGAGPEPLWDARIWCRLIGTDFPGLTPCVLRIDGLSA